MIMVGVVYRALQSLVAFARGFFFGSLASAPLPPVAAESRSDDSPFYWIESESDDETSESTTSTSPPPTQMHRGIQAFGIGQNSTTFNNRSLAEWLHTVMRCPYR